jgi:streptogramin lyase
VFVTGYYQAALTLYNTGGTTGATLAFTGGADCFVAKYSSAGAVVWAARIAGTTTSSDVGLGIATDSSGNVFVTGYYSAALTLYNTGGGTGATLAFTGGADCFVAKYSSAGAVVWAAQITGTTTSFDRGNGVATDSSGNVFVTGNYGAALTLYNTGGGTGATLPWSGSAGTYDCFLAKYSSTGSVLWAAQIASTGGEAGLGVATDSSGNVFVTGNYGTALTLYNSGATQSKTLPLPVGGCCFVAKYSSNGSSVIWASQIANTGASSTSANGIAIDPGGNVFVTGQYTTVAPTFCNADGSSGAANLSYSGGSGSSDCFLVKYNSNGNILDGTPASSNVLVDVTYVNPVITPYINGSNQTTLTATTAAATGIYVGGPTNYFNGSISELLVYGSTLTAAQRQQVEGYLTQKWKLGSQVVSTHPYKTIPPSISLPAQYYEVTPGNWARDWQPYMQSLAAANSSGITYTTTNITGGATYTANGWYGGGVIAPDGNIYFAPYVATNILKLTVATGQTTNITGGATFTSSGWCGGVLGPDGNIYFTPLNAPNILKLNPTTGVTTNITGGATYVGLGWLGGVVGPDSNIYFTPYSATNILKLNPFTGVTTNITGGATFTGAAKWNGGVLGPDGNMYFAPGGTTTILKLNVATGQTTNITGGASFIAGSNWVGGVLAPDGNIYFSPYTASNFLKLNVATGVTTNITGSATYMGAGWLGSVLGPDGNVYCVPSNASNILQLNVATGTTSNITGGALFTGNGKWLGGTLAFDGSIYFTPNGAANILKLSFTGLSRLPSSNYCLSAWANKF